MFGNTPEEREFKAGYELVGWELPDLRAVPLEANRLLQMILSRVKLED